jgi:hypothetical protein
VGVIKNYISVNVLVAVVIFVSEILEGIKIDHIGVDSLQRK